MRMSISFFSPLPVSGGGRVEMRCKNGISKFENGRCPTICGCLKSIAHPTQALLGGDNLVVPNLEAVSCSLQFFRSGRDGGFVQCKMKNIRIFLDRMSADDFVGYTPPQTRLTSADGYNRLL